MLAAVPVVAAVIAGCRSGDDDGGSTTTSTEPEDFAMQADDFVNLHDMTPVRGFFIDNRLGQLEEAIAVAEDTDGGGAYPVGTVVQLIPTEAMVKRAAGFDEASNDWEFFNLEVSDQGTKILTRGGSEVVNFADLSCTACHSKARPEFDFVCEKEHGCDPLPIGDDVIDSLQESDPRPRRAEP